MNRRQRRRAGMHRHRKPSTPPGVVIRDTDTGDLVFSVRDFLAFVRAEFEPAITVAELERRMRAVGVRRETMTAVNPDDPDDVIAVDVFVAPAGSKLARFDAKRRAA